MADDDVSYSRVVGLVFVFNLILGTGVLTMPGVFVKAGFVLGVIVLIGLCFMSFVQTTFLIEAMANANYVFRKTKRIAGRASEPDEELAALLEGGGSDEDDSQDDNEEAIRRAPPSNGHINEGFQATEIENETKSNGNGYGKQEMAISNYGTGSAADESPLFDITSKFEIGSMTQIFFNSTLSRMFFISIIIYLYGDVVIYNTLMSKSLREMICTPPPCNVSDLDHEHCWEAGSISRHSVYQLCVLGFVCLLTPLVYAGIKKNQGIQIVTIVLRWIAFTSMIAITLRVFIIGKNNGEPKAVDFIQMPKLFGICVYAFMCHHSLPSMITPIKNKKNLTAWIAGDYGILIFIYIIVALTGIFAFKDIQDVYTLNFQHNTCTGGPEKDNPAVIPVLDYFLPTFPIFTLFSSYTVIALTLINNMRILLEDKIDLERSNIRHAFPLIAIIPPLAISLFTEDVASIVGYVGSYSGGLIQYVFPCLLAYYSRKHVLNQHIQPQILDRNLGMSKTAEEVYKENNPFASPFQGNAWIIVTMVWWVISLILVTVDHIVDFTK